MEGSPGYAAVPAISPPSSTSPISHEGAISERIARTHAEGVAREELVAHQIAVHRDLSKAVGVQIACDLDGEARTQVRHVPRRIVDVGERALINALVQQVHL